MIFIETVCVLALMFTTGCQLAPRWATPKDQMYGDSSQIFIHHRNNFSKAYEVYVDQKKVDPEVLDKKGVKISKGKHTIDVFNKKTSSKIQHFDIEILGGYDTHYDICTLKSPGDFALEERGGTNNICSEHNLK